MNARLRVLTAVAAGYFLVMFAVSPVSVVLPGLAETLGVNLEAASWVMTAYLLPLTACLLPAGRLGDIVGHRRVFTLGLGLVTLAGPAIGLAPNLPLMLVARAVQGVGAALVSATSLPIITEAVDPARRGRSIGLTTMASSLGAMAGTGLAPLFVQYLDWRWVFYTGGVAGTVALVLARRMGSETLTVRRLHLDWPGAVLLLLTLVVASLSLNHFHDGPETFADGWRWHMPMHGVALVLLAMFVWVERRVASPLVELAQLGNLRFTTAIGANGVLHMTMMMTTFSTPFLIERGLQLGTAQTGALLVAMQACTTVMTLVGGWLHDRTHWRWLCPAALGMVASGLTVLGVFDGALTYGLCFGVIVWMGIGSGAFMTTNNTRIMGTLAPEHRGFASGMLETTRQYGHTLGVAVAAVGLAAALGREGAALEQQLAIRIGFSQAALLMCGIAWIGVGLAAYPLFERSQERAAVAAISVTRSALRTSAGLSGIRALPLGTQAMQALPAGLRRWIG